MYKSIFKGAESMPKDELKGKTKMKEANKDDKKWHEKFFTFVKLW